MDGVTLLEFNSWLWIFWTVYWFTVAFVVKKTKQSESLALRLEHSVPVFLWFILLCNGLVQWWGFAPLYSIEVLSVLGTILTAAGLTFATLARTHLGKDWSANVTLKENHKLIRSGPYRWTRHPIYSGVLLAGVGTMLTAATGDMLAGFLVLAVSLARKIAREEVVLTKEFGEEYVRFKQEVPALIPFVY